MSEISDIQQKYLRLIEIYADKNLDNNGAEAQNLISELVAVGNDDYKTAVGLSKSALKPMQKFYTASIDRTIAAARKNATPTQKTVAAPTPAATIQTTVAQAQPSVTTLNTAQPAVPENKTEPQTSVKPATPKSKPEPQTSVKPTAPKKVTTADKQKPQRPNRDLPQDIATDLNNYLYGTAADYPASVAAYISAEGSTPREKISHSLNVIDHIWNEYRKRPATPDAPHINRQKLLEVGLSIDGTQDEKIKAKVQKFLSFMSGKAQKYYLRKGKDYFLDDLYAAHRKVASDAALTEATAAAHVSGIFDNLPTDQDKLKYFKLLRKKKFLQHIPQELQDHLKEFEQTQKAAPKKQGDENMSNENTEETTFNPPLIQKWACRYANLNYKDYKDEASLLAALEQHSVIIQGNNVIDLNMEQTVHTFTPKTKEEMEADKAKKYALRDDGLSPEDLPSGKLTVSVITPDKDTINTPAPLKEPQEEDKPEKPKNWVQKKIEDYTAMSDAGKITNFDYDKENKEEFIASFDGATVHYSSPDNVNVSENAGIKVFETILNEPDNQNRTINFADNMPHDTAVHLKAACLLNGRAMTGAQPEFTAEDLQKLSQELGPERFKKLNEALNPQREAEQPVQAAPTEEKTPVSSVEELGKAAESIRGIKEKFNKMKEDGLIAVTTNLETQKPEIIAGPALSDKSEEEQKKAVADANALIADAAEIVTSSKTLSGKLNEAQQKDNNTFNEERLEQIRNGMDQKKLAEHDAKADNVALIHAKRMGLVDIEVKDSKGNEVKTIEDKAQRDAYTAERNKNPELKARIAEVVKQNSGR